MWAWTRPSWPSPVSDAGTVRWRRGRCQAPDRSRAVGEDDRELEASVEREGDAFDRRIGLPRRGVGAQGLDVREDVVGDDEAARLDMLARECEQPLVVVLLRVDEDHVEDVLDLRQRLERVSRQQLDRLLEPGLRDVLPPRLDLGGIALEREHPPSEMPNTRAEPDRRVPARAADLEHLAVPLRRHEREQELSRRARHLPRAQLARDAFLTLPRVLLLQPSENGSDLLVEHQRMSTFTTPSSTTTGNVSTGMTAGSDSGRPEQMSNCDPWRGQITTPSSRSNSPSQSGPSSWEQRSSSAHSRPPRL